ncbi:hypothetical protein [Aliikangiella sp. G2MR2-5]|uniref:hypothetical protein n=1 Tax=Aliikangiella sp. G2MR2-5 TaxID=2788943 RepID=UPI0018AB5F06|nr:hypothetical protein [Aliikangiella sp. G2MR2-5]
MKKLNAIAAAISLTAFSQLTMADSDVKVERLLAKSDLVIQGEVVNIEYKDSNEGLPHTFVTYRVDNLIAGNTRNKTVTLRFIGGEQKKGDIIRYLSVSEVPTFEKGEKDILFVSKNNSVICPLVNCSQGRYRDLNGLVSNEHGQPLMMNGQGEFKLGKDSMVEQISSTNRKTGFAKGLSNYENESKPQVEKNTSVLDTQTFVAMIKDKSISMQANGLLKGSSFKSSNAKLDFSTPLFKAATPKDAAQSLNPLRSPKQPTATGRAKSAYDQWEEQAILESNGEPVLNVPAKFKQSK